MATPLSTTYVINRHGEHIHTCTCSNNRTTYGCAKRIDRLRELEDLNLCSNTDNHVPEGADTRECSVCHLYDAR